MNQSIKGLTEAAQLVVARLQLDANGNDELDRDDVPRIDAALADVSLPEETRYVAKSLRSIAVGEAPRHPALVLPPADARMPTHYVGACPPPRDAKEKFDKRECTDAVQGHFTRLARQHKETIWVNGSLGGPVVLSDQAEAAILSAWPAAERRAYKTLQHETKEQLEQARNVLWRERPTLSPFTSLETYLFVLANGYRVLGQGHWDGPGVTLYLYDAVRGAPLAAGYFVLPRDHKKGDTDWYATFDPPSQIVVDGEPLGAYRPVDVEGRTPTPVRAQRQWFPESPELAGTPGNLQEQGHWVKLLRMGQTHERLGELASAKWLLSAALQTARDVTFPEIGESILALARVENGLGEHAAAITHIEELFARFPRWPARADALVVRAQALLALGRRDAARRDVTEALGLTQAEDDAFPSPARIAAETLLERIVAAEQRAS